MISVAVTSSGQVGASPVREVRETPTGDDARVPTDKVTVTGLSPQRPEAEPAATDLRKADPFGDSQAQVRAKGKSSTEVAQLIAELEARDREVRAHEAAHAAAGGSLAGAPSFSFQTGPDGRSYAVGGEVSIELAPGRTPQETMDRARRIRAAALAPRDPSSQDLSVASSAAAMESRAMMEASRARQQAAAGPKSGGSNGPKDASKPDGKPPGAATPDETQPPDVSAARPVEGEGNIGKVLRFQPGGTAHMHAPDGCGPCARNVAQYRSLAMSA